METWRDSRRQGDNTLLPAALPSLLLAVDAAGQRALLDTARKLIDKVLCWMTFTSLLNRSLNRVTQAPSPQCHERYQPGVHFRWCPLGSFECV